MLNICVRAGVTVGKTMAVAVIGYVAPAVVGKTIAVAEKYKKQ